VAGTYIGWMIEVVVLSGPNTGFTVGYIVNNGDTLATNSQKSIPVSELVVHTGDMDCN